MKKILAIILLVSVFMVALVGCNDDTPVESYVIDNQKYEKKEDIENATKLDTLNSKENIYASIYFIESPKGTKYKVSWYLDGKNIKTEEKEMTSDAHGFIIYKLEKKYLSKGKLKMQISNHDINIREKEIELK